ncbi:hypothetical protein ACHAXM_002635 [Skeletonema potamos]|jgi:hypothetical protein
MSSRSRQLWQQSCNEESPTISIAKNRVTNTKENVTYPKTKNFAPKLHDRLFTKKDVAALHREVEGERQQQQLPTDEVIRLPHSKEWRDQPTLMITPMSVSLKIEEAAIEVERRDDAPPSPPPSPPSSPPPSSLDPLSSSPSWSNLDYIQADDTFDTLDTFAEVKQGTNNCNYGCLDNVGNNNDNNNSCFMMIVDDSPSVEPLSCKEKLLQPALGCDEQEIESCIDHTCYCSNNNSSSSTGSNNNKNEDDGDVNMGGMETTRVGKEEEGKEYRQRRNHETNNNYDDGKKMEDVTTFIDMIKTLLEMRFLYHDDDSTLTPQ